MAEISIIEVTRQTGIRPSALRYYEEIGLVRSTRRIAGRRQYDESILQRLALIQTGQQAGFTLAELNVLLNNVLDAAPGQVGWHGLFERKLKDMDTMLRHIESMKSLLNDIMACDDTALVDCIVRTGKQHARTQP